jgi:hypothetical protein
MIEELLMVTTFRTWLGSCYPKKKRMNEIQVELLGPCDQMQLAQRIVVCM